MRDQMLLQNPMEIYKLLDRSNCRKCHEATCLAFAAAVFKGAKSLDMCPKLSAEVLSDHHIKGQGQGLTNAEGQAAVEGLKTKIRSLDLRAAAQRIGAAYDDGKLTLKVLGKNFSVDQTGHLQSDIHIHPWVAVPVLDYIINGAGVPLSGKWVSFRELEGGQSRHGLFEQRCEKPLKRVADTYTDLFEDMIRIFNGKPAANHYAADITLVLHPLPLLPLLICYWKPEGRLESSLHIFFDATAQYNLNIESIYALGAGLVRMFEKISLRHGLQ